VPVYASLEDRDREFTRGDLAVVTSILSGLQVVDEDKCEWEQVLEFRADVEVRDKYKRFLHWLNVKMVDQPESLIREEIELRHADYKNALHKHGIVTTIGDWAIALGGMGTVFAASPESVLLQALALIGGLGAKVVINYIKSPEPPDVLSYVAEAKRVLGPSDEPLAEHEAEAD